MRVISITLLTLSLFSCKKYTCKCTVALRTTMGTYKADGGEETYQASSKKKAENRCIGFEAGKKDKDTTAACALL